MCAHAHACTHVHTHTHTHTDARTPGVVLSLELSIYTWTKASNIRHANSASLQRLLTLSTMGALYSMAYRSSATVSSLACRHATALGRAPSRGLPCRKRGTPLGLSPCSS